MVENFERISTRIKGKKIYLEKNQSYRMLLEVESIVHFPTLFDDAFNMTLWVREFDVLLGEKDAPVWVNALQIITPNFITEKFNQDIRERITNILKHYNVSLCYYTLRMSR